MSSHEQNGGIILAVDPSVTNMGYVVYDESSDSFLTHGTSTFKSGTTRESRWWKILCFLDELVEQHSVNMILTEYQFEGSLLQTVAICGIVAGKHELPVRYIPPKSWKKWGLGSSLFDKEQTKDIVFRKYPELNGSTEHVCDSVGMVLSYKNNPYIGLTNTHGKGKDKYVKKTKAKAAK